MKSVLRIGLRALLVLLLITAVYIGGFLIYGTLTDWKPEERLDLEEPQHTVTGELQDSVFSILNWNIGYAGLGAESDFFFDKGNMLVSKGAMVRPQIEFTQKNLASIRTVIASTQADFAFLQEVDVQSKRSYFQNQLDSIRQDRPDYYAGFAPNYRVDYVPTPLMEPWKAMGQTHSGLVTLSAVEPKSSERIQLPGAYGWPTRIFQLDRCLSLHRIALSATEQELVLINAHLSAYDAGGSLRKEQMACLKELAIAEYQAGNYVVIGGDWNQCPPYFRCDGFLPGHPAATRMLQVDATGFSEDWVWAYDATLPTNRHVDAPYQPGQTFVTLIDYFLLSPNLKLRKVKTLDQGFRASDHQPVWVQVELIR